MWKTLISLGLAAVHLSSMAIEEPSYDVVQRLDGAEVRQYAPYVVAQVQVAGSADEAGNQAFFILLGYISGKNKGATKLEMTAPVTQSPSPSPTSAPSPSPAASSMKLEMTAPVTQAAVPGGYVVQFVLPKEITLATAPEPLDPRVQLHEVPGRRVGVIRYSGFWSQANFDEHLVKLEAALRAAQLSWTGEPTLSRYNAPFTPWFMRRNEIWLTLSATPPVTAAP